MEIVHLSNKINFTSVRQAKWLTRIVQAFSREFFWSLAAVIIAAYLYETIRPYGIELLS